MINKQVIKANSWNLTDNVHNWYVNFKTPYIAIDVVRMVKSYENSNEK